MNQWHIGYTILAFGENPAFKRGVDRIGKTKAAHWPATQQSTPLGRLDLPLFGGLASTTLGKTGGGALAEQQPALGRQRQRIGRPHNNRPHWEDWTCPSLEDSPVPHWAGLSFPVSKAFQERHCPHGRQVVAHWPNNNRPPWVRLEDAHHRRTRCT